MGVSDPRLKQVPNEQVVSVPHSSEKPITALLAFAKSDQIAGTYSFDGTNTAYVFRFSDPASAIAFKMRFG